MLRVLVFVLATLVAAPAFADSVDFLLTRHEAPHAEDMVQGTVSFRVGDVAYFASDKATYAVQATRKRPRITKHDGHPAQKHHKSARVIELGDAGALVALQDDRRKLKLVRFDAATKQWASVERPIGFVPRAHARVKSHIVFPQTARSPAWYAYEIGANEFVRIERPRDTTRCYGTTFADGHTAVVAGVDDDGAPCAVRFDPVKKTWSDLPAPPAVPGPRTLRVGRTTYLFGALAETVSYTNGAWKKHAVAPDLAPDAQLVETSGAVLTWHGTKAGLTQSTWKPSAPNWKTRSENLPILLRAAVPLGAGRWVAVARVTGRPALLVLDYKSGLSAEERSENRKLLGEGTNKKEDWATASEAEKQAAIQEGLGAVERYVPPERDASGKVTTKGAWVFSLGEELVVWPVTPKKCKRFLERMIAQWPTSTIGTTWKVHRGAGFARAGKKVLYSPTGQCRDTSKCPGDFFSEQVTPLSQVGPIFSFTTHQNQLACDTSTAFEHWTAIDLRTGQDASLTAVIKEDSILEALKSHKNFRNELADVTTLDAALAVLRKTDPRAGRAYAFGSWRSATRRVELRLEYHPDSPDLVEAIKLWVEPTDEFFEVFEQAARMAGRYMSGS